VAGFRLDAIPYLFEKEGTNCENLPETHVFLKRLRAEMDKLYPNRIFLAEANLPPAEVSQYFAEGDECHMAFHFPLMPRIFMSLRKENRKHVEEIIRSLPETPQNCQWALFLRNHDELTLETVSEEERKYMIAEFASESPNAVINLGIKRRLAPLLHNGRRQLELCYSLLFSLPGSPVLYYGDEIGMGDDIYLKDRHSVRTPMQWSADKNAGFSECDPQKLYLPLISAPVYGYQALNVESQQKIQTSFLNWMKRMIRVRQTTKAFGRGKINMLSPANHKILAFTREYQDEVILVVNNLSRFVQPVELDLKAYAGRAPAEMIGTAVFPEITDKPYFLSLGPHGFYWFRLR
jgi:maltose alpha-D-glucosyltransferase/alpha-amylase